MDEISVFQPAGNESKENGGFQSWLTFMIKGFIFPCFSPSFYKAASKKSLMGSIAFLFFFAFVITFEPTIELINEMSGVGSEIQGVYERGEFPNIVIEDGIAKVDGTQPFVFEDNGTIVAIDTTGGMNEIDTRLYSQGFLLTQTELHILNENEYQVLPLIDLNNEFENPIMLDEANVLDLWNTVSLWITIFAFGGILLWNSIVRLAYIALIGLVIWGIVLLLKNGVGYSHVLITGILANVPVTYLKFLLNLADISFLTLYTLLLIVIWSFALWVVLKDNDVDQSEKPMVAM